MVTTGLVDRKRCYLWVPHPKHNLIKLILLYCTGAKNKLVLDLQFKVPEVHSDAYFKV